VAGTRSDERRADALANGARESGLQWIMSIRRQALPRTPMSDQPAWPQSKENIMELGAFSISLAVKDLGASRAFYEKFGFQAFGGDVSQNWLIMKNGDTVIGLFQGMFEKNTLTFNPGWDKNAAPMESFSDIRELQRELKAAGVTLLAEADESTTGPASLVAVDPDGNPILIDQHV
jgi:catechol 2,3-dioxygenase-like lactoylglutathione lyase family enzyme